MDNEIDFTTEIISRDNKFTITNVEFLNSPPVENEKIRAIKLLQLLNSETFNPITQNENESKKLALKQKIQSSLLNSLERLDNFMNFLRFACYEKNFFKFKVLPNKEIAHEKEKNEIKKINYLKKIDSLDKVIDKFSKKIQKINEEKIASQIIFSELVYLKDLGFNIENNFQFPSLKENLTFKISHRILENFEPIMKITKYNFDLNFNLKTKKFELSNPFFEKFKNKYKLQFDLVIKIDNKELYINIDKILEGLIIENLGLTIKTDANRYKVMSYLVFYTKYLLYIMLKLEVRSLMEVSRNNHFNLKNFNFLLQEFNKEFILTLSYFNNFSLSLKAKKLTTDDFKMDTSTSKTFTELYKEIDMSNLMITDDDITRSNDILKKYSNVIKVSLLNLITEVKFSKIVKEFESIGIKNTSLLDAFDNCLYSRSLYKLSLYILRESFIATVISKLNSIKNYYWIYSYNTNIFNHTYKFLVTDIGFQNKKFEIFFIFDDKNSLFSFEYKQFLKNTVHLFEKDTVIIEKNFKEVNYDYIFLALDNLLS